MSFELSKDHLAGCIFRLMRDVEHYDTGLSDLEKRIEDIATSKISAKERFKQIESLKRLLVGRVANRDQQQLVLEQYIKELAAILRMELLIGLVPDVESKKMGTL